MKHFIAHKNTRLMMEDVDIAELAKTTPTPFYVYSANTIRARYSELCSAVNHSRVKIFFAVKANSNIAVLSLLGKAGANMDIVSAGEMKRALAAGIPGNRIVFSGVGKTDDELEFALKNYIYQINAESLPELIAINRVAAALKVQAPVALRVNPDVDAETHAKISTGKDENKFGISWDHVEAAFAKAAALSNINVLGLSAHIGSQIITTQPFINSAARMEEMVTKLRAQGHSIQRISLGGGLGIPYQGETIPLTEFGKLVHDFADKMNCDVELEPGRFLVGEAGLLISRVIYVKEASSKNFLIVDAAMNDLLRPTLYEAHHPICKVIESPSAPANQVYDIVGPICETGDYLAENRALSPCQAGDLIAISMAGAYGATMSSMYNSRTLIGEVLVDGNRAETIRKPLTIEQQLLWETIPAN
ncbi:MAG: diaminopimelate decarboxylase [Alphaproteobacteria bacterium]|nr:diaminopimelate decarboxylase [Alphaproteobacteria bacterium]